MRFPMSDEEFAKALANQRERYRGYWQQDIEWREERIQQLQSSQVHRDDAVGDQARRYVARYRSEIDDLRRRIAS